MTNMLNGPVSWLAKYPDLDFIPAYISTFLSSQYVLAKYPTIVAQISTSISTQNNPIADPELWQIPSIAMVPICVALATSISSIILRVEVDKIYASLLLIALIGTLGAGWTLDLGADLVVFGLLPWVLVSALLLARIGQKVFGRRLNGENERNGAIDEKFGLRGSTCATN